jgi:hypothetical protein
MERSSGKLLVIMSIILSIMLFGPCVTSLCGLVKGKIDEHYSIISKRNNIDNIVDYICRPWGTTTF